jgi:ribosomal protein S18 acetylase RimI-like enzyme
VHLTTPEGRRLLTYVEGVRDGQPWADLVVLDPGVGVAEAAGALLRDRAGWVVSGTPELGAALLAAGGRPVRHAHTMERDLADVPTGWGEAALPDGVGLLAPSDRLVEDVVAAHEAAFGPGHPDRAYDTRGAVGSRESLGHLLAGAVLGPLLPGSALAVAASGDVVGAMTIHHRGDLAWVGTVFRHPDPAYAGLGSAMLRRALAILPYAGRTRAGLAVTEGNPARGLYERLGFTVTDTSLTVALPVVGARG